MFVCFDRKTRYSVGLYTLIVLARHFETTRMSKNTFFYFAASIRVLLAPSSLSVSTTRDNRCLDKPTRKSCFTLCTSTPLVGIVGTSTTIIHPVKRLCAYGAGVLKIHSRERLREVVSERERQKTGGGRGVERERNRDDGKTSAFGKCAIFPLFDFYDST